MKSESGRWPDEGELCRCQCQRRAGFCHVGVAMQTAEVMSARAEARAALIIDLGESVAERRAKSKIRFVERTGHVQMSTAEWLAS